MSCVLAACPLPPEAIPAATVPRSTLPVVGLLPWGPPRPWCGDSKVWQEMFNPAETPGSITKARDMVAASAEEEVHAEGVGRGALGTAAKSQGQMRSQAPRVKQVVSCLVTGLQKITRLPPSPSACSQKANVSVAMPECLFWQRPGTWPAGMGRHGKVD